MFTRYVLRGMTAGAVAGVAFGLFVALVGNPLIAYAETFESGSHGGSPVVSGAVTTAVGALGGVLFGMLLGAVVFGVVFYFFEPAIPGRGATKSYLLAAAGFLTVSGAPWVVLPPQPPGVEQTLPAGARITWYLVMMVTAAVACGLSGYAANRLQPTYGREMASVGALVPLGLVLITAALAPANPVAGPIPDGFASVFRTITGVGQVGLWLVMASAHVWLLQRERDDGSVGDHGSVRPPAESATVD